MSPRKFKLVNLIYSVSFSNFPKRVAAWPLLSLCLFVNVPYVYYRHSRKCKEQEHLALRCQEENIQRTKWSLINGNSC